MNETKFNSLSRRGLLKGAASMAALGALGPVARSEPRPQAPVTLKPGSVILFQGDSITDAGRDKGVLDANSLKGIGKGYAAMAVGGVLLDHAGLELQCYNRGISGNKIPDLHERWQPDAIDLKPDVLSILIGVNDLWHTFAFGSKYKATIDDYEKGYRALIERTQREVPGVQIVICEPFTTRTSNEFKPLAEFRKVSRTLAEEMKLTFVPFQAMFDEAVKAAPAEFWLWDGVHPSPAGQAIMAQRWREAVGV